MSRVSQRPTEDKIEELKTATRAANLALRDMKSVLKEIRDISAQVDARLEAGIQKDLDDRINSQISTTLASYESTLQEAMRSGVAHVQSEFDKLGDVLLGRDPESVKEGKEDLIELTKKSFCPKHHLPRNACKEFHVI